MWGRSSSKLLLDIDIVIHGGSRGVGRGGDSLVGIDGGVWQVVDVDNSLRCRAVGVGVCRGVFIRDISRGCQRRKQPLGRLGRRLGFDAGEAVASQVRGNALWVGVDVRAVQTLVEVGGGVVQHGSAWAVLIGLPRCGPR